MTTRSAQRRLFVTALLIASCFVLGCPNARRGPGGDSYGTESASEAMQEDMMEAERERADR